MAAKEGSRDESGQSVLELLFMLPILVGMAVLLIRINMAIQVSINNQKYARAQTLYLTFNNSVYPVRDLFGGAAPPFNRMEVGISEESPPISTGGERFVPSAVTQMITRTRALSGGEGDPQEEPDLRGIVRIRSTVALCTPTHLMTVDGNKVPVHGQRLREGVTPSAFEYCRGP